MADPAIPDSAFRLKWRETWPGEAKEDYVAIDLVRGEIGRVYQHTTGGSLEGHWFWGITDFTDKFELARMSPEEREKMRRRAGFPKTGYEPGVRHAALALERSWFGEPAPTPSARSRA